MTEKEMVLVLSTVFMSTQIIYFMISKASTNRIIKDHQESMDKILDSISAVIASFEPHIERTRQVHDMVDELKRQHAVRGPDGNLMMFAPVEMSTNCKEILKVSSEISRVTQETSATLREVSVLLREIAAKLETHQDNCKEQFHKVEKSIDHATLDCRMVKDLS